MVNKKSMPIKSILLDQKVISGLGNIYVDEVLYLSKLNPLKAGKLITKEDIENIIKNSIIVLNKATCLGGTTVHSFQSSHGVTGRFQNELLVHTKKECAICGCQINKIKVGGRGTYYCPSCQK